MQASRTSVSRRLTTQKKAPGRALLFWLAALVAATPAAAQSSAFAAALPDPHVVVVVVDDAGEVGLRISDAQLVHELVIGALRKRLGNDAVAYEGTKKNAAQMKKMLGKNSETTVQDSQLAWFDAVEKNAPWRVRVRFGTKKGEHFIRATCRKRDVAADATPADEKVGRGKNFSAARDDLDAQLAAFCPALLPAQPSTSTPSSTPAAIPGLRKKELKPWTPPPRRD